MYTLVAQTQPVDMSVVLDNLSGMGRSILARLPYLGVALLVFLAFLLAARMVRRAILFAGHRTALDATLADLLGRLAAIAMQILGLFVAAVIIFPAFRAGDLVAGLGITSVAIGFAFKDVLQNFFAGVFLLWRRPFTVGDQIRSGQYEGTVEEITIRSTRLITYDGERAILPNSDVYTSAILVHTAYPRRRVRFVVGVGYQDSIEEARAAIHDVLRTTDGVLDDPGPWVYVSDLAASSVNFTVFFWTGSEQANVLRVSDRVATGIKMALDEAAIDMPYPHTVLLFKESGYPLPASLSSEGEGEGSRPDGRQGAAEGSPAGEHHG